jgi:UDP-N-acetyl-D-mannosaminuronic acid dehydrogenase
MSPDVCILGLGYIGLPTAALLASRGLRVAGVDTDPRVLAAVSAGRPHIAEPGLAEPLREAVAAGRLTAAAEPVAAPVFLVTVPTPLGPGNRPMMAHVEAAADSLAPVLKQGDLIILESTSPVGTTARMAARLAARRPELRTPGDVAMAYCPERVLPGRILRELVANDRCVGGLTPACTDRAAGFYEGFVEGAVLHTTAAAAEMVKLAENSFRDVNIAFANELSILAERHGLDAREVIALANRHPRVDILRPGPGVGGHCIAVDPWFLVDSAPEDARLIRAAREVNDAMPARVVERVRRLAEADPDLPITCLGLAFKADVDDLRGSPALAIARELAALYPGRVAVVEPHVAEAPHGLGAPLIGLDAALDRGGILVLLVDHSAFAAVPAARLRGARILDTRGLWRA